MPRNDGSKSEQIFDGYIEGFGKDGQSVPFFDKKYLTGLNNKRSLVVPNQPSDRVVVRLGVTFFAEVKSSQNATSFPFSNVKGTQWGWAKRLTRAGSDYRFFLHNIVTDQWYEVPAQHLLKIRAEGRQSVKWILIEEFKNDDIS